jgi:hypothetical protein
MMQIVPGRSIRKCTENDLEMDSEKGGGEILAYPSHGNGVFQKTTECVFLNSKTR